MLSWFRPRHDRKSVARVYEQVVDQARHPEFYRTLEVADSLDGRFDMVVLHMILVLRRLKGRCAKADAFAQALFNHMFVDMDQSLREIGVGDLGVGRRVKQMGEAFQGRVVAYEQALDGGQDGLERALLRNVYRGETPDGDAPARLARYVRAVDDGLLKCSVSKIVNGKIRFDADPA